MPLVFWQMGVGPVTDAGAGGGCVRVAEEVAVHAWESVTVTYAVPAVSPVMVAVVAPFDQA
jgi:hypothetical protein